MLSASLGEFTDFDVANVFYWVSCICPMFSSCLEVLLSSRTTNRCDYTLNLHETKLSLY